MAGGLAGRAYRSAKDNIHRTSIFAIRNISGITSNHNVIGTIIVHIAGVAHRSSAEVVRSTTIDLETNRGRGPNIV